MTNFHAEQIQPGFIFFAHGVGAPTDAEFAAVAPLAQQPAGWRCLVISAGGGLTLNQRKEFDAQLQKGGVTGRTAFVTESPATRSLLSAVAWMARLQLKTFPLSALTEACAWLRVTDAERPAVQAAVDRAMDKLGRPLFEAHTMRLSA
jgi:hypothetical protein